MDVVTPTGRPKTVRSGCVVEDFVGIFLLWLWFFKFSVKIGAYVIGLCQISSFFSGHIIDVHTTTRVRLTIDKK